MLFCGERIGDGSPNAPLMDIAVDPLDGTTLTAQVGLCVCACVCVCVIACACV